LPEPHKLPRWYLKMGNITNPAMFRLLPVPRGFVLLNLTGRKSGKPRPRPIRALRDGDTLYGVALAGKYSDWLKNARVHPDISVKLGRKTRPASLREVTDAVEKERATQLYVDTVVPYDYQDYPMVHWDFPTRRKIIDAHRRWVDRGIMVAIDLKDEA
jgi:deazaflavin-dependent oxidoreductase (nitroreductase family)